jgi:RimJ/RimL family protein N-acetyltransferase
MEATDNRAVISIQGEQVALGPMARDQISIYHRWLNNFDTLRSQGEPPQLPDTLDSVERWYQSYVDGRDDVAWFTVYERESYRPVGWTELKDIDRHNGTAEFAIMIGAPDARGRGFGTEVTKLMLAYGFKGLGLFNIHLYYMEFNAGARKAYERAGFKEYGRRTGAYRVGDERWDVVYMQCLRSDFQSDG